ncbi:uncharacterized protein LOC143216114 [Lasioglossum baleicum]|uniref:uncharacterized protein LOC143216114 n=1 Tax=Lasioglossum baleicum TaxID=434251 RepID=UPI003FCCCCEB
MKNEICVDNKECVCQLCIRHRHGHGDGHEYLDEYFREHDQEHEHRLRLEVARSGMIAERMTPTIVYTPKIIFQKFDTLAESSVVHMKTVKKEKNGMKTEELKNLWNTSGTGVDQTTMEILGLPTCPDKQIRENDKDEVMSHRSIESNVSERIAEILSRGDTSARSNKIRSNALSRSAVGISTKYNLNETDMTLLYSLTPSVESECLDNMNERTLLAGETNNNHLHSPNRSNEGKQQDRDFEDPNFIWFDDLLEDNEKHDRSFSSAHTGVYSNVGSDTLELPSSTVLELLETSGDDFRNDISISANEIIAELDANDIYASIFCLVAEIFERVYTLCDTRSIDQYGELHVSTSTSTLSPLLSRCLSSSTLLSTVKDEIYHPAEKNVGKRERSREDIPIFVVREIVHHVIDVNNVNVANDQFERKYENTATETIADWSFKQAKDCANADLKEAENTTRNQITLTEEENESVTVTAEPVIGAKTESVAVFEFHTIARRNLIADQKEVELNFRVETSRDRYIVDDGDDGKHETLCNTCPNDEATVLLAGGSSSGSVSGSDSISCAEREASFGNSFENESDDKQTESPKLSEFEDLVDDETSLKCSEFSDDCIYCVNHCCALDHDRDGFLPSINEESESSFVASTNTTG